MNEIETGDAPSDIAGVRWWRYVVTYRRLLVIAVHSVLWMAAFGSAFALRFDFHVAPVFASRFVSWLVMLLCVRIVATWLLGGFYGLWRYTGLRDVLVLVRSTIAGSVAFAVLVIVTGDQDFPRSVWIIDGILSLCFVGGFRLSVRLVRDLSVQMTRSSGELRRFFIVGAGNAGESLAREIRKGRQSLYHIAGFVDDDVSKIGERIHGIPIRGTVSHLPRLVDETGVREVIVAVPSASGAQIRRIFDACKRAKVQVRTLPDMGSLLDGRVTMSKVRPVAIQDLLRRDPVRLEVDKICGLVEGQRVVVTGAGGSIGSELCRQIARFSPNHLVLVERNENGLFNIHRELQQRYPDLPLLPQVVDVTDRIAMEQLLATSRPTALFHAAAHKHVPLMEHNPLEALKNNTFGTRVVSDLCDRLGVERFVLVSTDKAVRPRSVMGASKRAAEIYVQALNRRSRTRFVTVRFGNVLGSNGSVVPIFQEQIARGGPVTVTHPDMRRFFMTIPEACELILQAGAMGRGGEIYILDMGESVLVADLARDLIVLSGLRPAEDIEIVFTGIRPGEKLEEQLVAADDEKGQTDHPKIFAGRSVAANVEQVSLHLDRIADAIEAFDMSRARQALCELIPDYQPDPEGLFSRKVLPTMLPDKLGRAAAPARSAVAP